MHFCGFQVFRNTWNTLETLWETTESNGLAWVSGPQKPIRELQLRDTGFERKRRRSGGKSVSYLYRMKSQTNPRLGRRASLGFQEKKNVSFENHIFPQLSCRSAQRQEGCQPERSLCRNPRASCSLAAVSKDKNNKAPQISDIPKNEGRRPEDRFSKLYSFIWFIRSDWIVNPHASVNFLKAVLDTLSVC